MAWMLEERYSLPIYQVSHSDSFSDAVYSYIPRIKHDNHHKASQEYNPIPPTSRRSPIKPRHHRTNPTYISTRLPRQRRRRKTAFYSRCNGTLHPPSIIPFPNT